jgi:hypothetical protein
MQTISVAGIPIPSASPVFLAALAIHITAGLTTVVVGLAAMLAPKRRGRHSILGTIYFGALSVVAASMTILAIMRWKEDRYLFALGVGSFLAATAGRLAARRRWANWPRMHIAGMGISYVLLLVAFYVDNGAHLPLWRSLPAVFYWLLPVIIGIPLILRSMLSHAVVLDAELQTRN